MGWESWSAARILRSRLRRVEQERPTTRTRSGDARRAEHSGRRGAAIPIRPDQDPDMVSLGGGGSTVEPEAFDHQGFAKHARVPPEPAHSRSSAAGAYGPLQ